MSGYGCTNPACSLALIGSYIVWFVSHGRDLRALLVGMGVSQEVAISMVEDAASDGWTVKVIDARHGIVAEREDDDQWSVWELRMHQSFDDEFGAFSFGEASDAAFEARGKPPPLWTVMTFTPDE